MIKNTSQADIFITHDLGDKKQVPFLFLHGFQLKIDAINNFGGHSAVKGLKGHCPRRMRQNEGRENVNRPLVALNTGTGTGSGDGRPGDDNSAPEAPHRGDRPLQPYCDPTATLLQPLLQPSKRPTLCDTLRVKCHKRWWQWQTVRSDERQYSHMQRSLVLNRFYFDIQYLDTI